MKKIGVKFRSSENERGRGYSVTKAERKESARDKRLMDNYKLTTAEWNQISAFQQDVCWGCRQPEPVRGRSLATDHEHESGLVRGILCSRCNPVLGKLERAFRRYGLGKVDGLTVCQWLLRMASYVEFPPATKALGHSHFGYPGRVGTKKHRKLLKKSKKRDTKS